MNKLFFISVFVLSFNFCFSQTSTEKWNEYKKQYEYYDSNGNMIAYKIYNSYKKQWETYSVQTNTYQPQPVVNTELVQKTLTTLQAKYDANLARLKEEVRSSINFILEDAKKYGYSYEDALKVVEIYKKQYGDVILSGKFDLSSDAQLGKLLKFSVEGCIDLCVRYFPQK